MEFESLVPVSSTQLVKNKNTYSSFKCTDEISLYRCPRCPNFQTELLAHFKQHSESNHHSQTLRIKKLPYKCRRCRFSSHSRYLLLRHCILESERQRCLLCKFKSNDVNLLSLHIFTKHLKRLQQRKKIASDPRQVQCNFCPHKVRWRAELKYHILVKHTPVNEIKWFYCDQCPKKFKLQKCLQQHVYNRHLKEAIWRQCEYCAYKCKGKRELKSHILRIHTSKNELVLYDCDRCLFHTNEKTLLNRHIVLQHSSQSDQIICTPSSQELRNENTSIFFRCTQRMFPYKCFKCPYFQTEFLSDLMHHSKSNHNDQTLNNPKHKCQKCDFVSHSKYIFIRHCLQEYNRQQCQHCNYISKDANLLALHIFSKHLDLTSRRKHQNNNIRQVQCQLCPYKVRWKAELKSHILAKHTPSEQIPWIYCDRCSSRFKSKKNLQRHMRNLHMNINGDKETPPLKCEHCSYHGKRKTELESHILRKHTNKPANQALRKENTAVFFTCTADILPYECLKCQNFQTNVMSHLIHHSKFNHNIRPLKNPTHKCPKCDFATHSRYLLIKHCLIENKRQECQQCNYRSKDINLLALHIFRSHLDLSGTKKYQNTSIRHVQCQFCSYKVRWKAELKSHILAKHTPFEEIKWFNCDQCSFKFKSKKGLKQHIHNKHVNINRKNKKQMTSLKCEYCPYKGKRTDELRRHVLRKHTADSEIFWYECDKCSFRSKEKIRLSEHVARKHVLDGKKHMCEYCGYRAVWNYEIKRHIASKHTPNEAACFSCEECVYKAKTKKTLYMHMATKHKHKW